MRLYSESPLGNKSIDERPCDSDLCTRVTVRSRACPTPSNFVLSSKTTTRPTTKRRFVSSQQRKPYTTRRELQHAQVFLTNTTNLPDFSQWLTTQLRQFGLLLFLANRGCAYIKKKSYEKGAFQSHVHWTFSTPMARSRLTNYARTLDRRVAPLSGNPLDNNTFLARHASKSS